MALKTRGTIEQIIFLYVIVSAITITAQGAASTGLKNTVWQPICGLSEELDLVGGDVLYEADEMLKYSTTMATQAARSRAYAAKNIGSPRARRAYLVAAYLELKATAAYREYRTKAVESHIRAARGAAYLKGRLDDFLKMLAQTKSTDNACLLEAEDPESPASLAAGKIGTTPCKLTITGLARAKAAARSYVTADGFKKIATGPGATDRHQPAAGSDKCQLLAAHTSDGFVKTTTPAGPITTMAGYMQLPTSAADITLETLPNLKDKQGKAEEAWQEAHQAISGIVTSQEKDFKNETETTDKWAQLTDIVKRVLLPKEKQAATDVEAAITNELGGKEKDKITELEGIINEETIPAGVAGLPQEKKLGAISSLTELTTIIYHYELSVNSEITDLNRKLQNKTEAKPTTTAEVCKSHTTDAPCRKAGCEFDKDKTPKCFPKPNESKEEKEKEGDNKTTLTECAATEADKCDKNKCTWDKEKNQCKVKEGAAVISAVIKAPLLLAFLLS
uniref:Variant surface glycoprotein n=1 Tax=Trypanosoma brucei TaxID=5691 RepID=A0A1V0FYM1_9TRYP|nr:variant surface glycoprotein [Trypanosoma brucei]